MLAVADDVVVRYGQRTVLEHVTLALDRGEAMAVQGRSGSGKTTLVHLLAGLAAPTSGRVVIEGQDLARMDADAQARLRLERIGLVFQHFNLIPDLTAEENVRLPMSLARRKGARTRSLELLERVGMGAHVRAFPGSLSGGEMQRVAIARALANDPVLVLADEPTANLDEANAALVLGMLAEQAREGRAVLLASHDPLANRYFHRRWTLQAGRLARAKEPPSPSMGGDSPEGEAPRAPPMPRKEARVPARPRADVSQKPKP